MMTLDHYVLSCIMYYVQHFDSNKTMTFEVNNKKLLKKYTKIWERVCSLMNIELDNKPVYDDNDKYITTKVKSYGDKINRMHHIRVYHW